MVFNTVTVGAAVTPKVIETYISHYINRKALHQNPTAHISYHEGIILIRRFLAYASHHTVEDLQAFTSQWVPNPRWVRVEDIIIPQEQISQAADALMAQLGHHGIDKIGGETWWQWRREGSKLKAEWVEMRRDHTKRKHTGQRCKRVMLYIHGGAYFFGSVDEHRYQLQRHARKLEAKVFARQARYRLAPQFPFPCALLDCLAAYLYLLTVQDPSEIVMAGDSAGGGMILSMLVILRDQNLPLPAGAILISPWCDLTHSFPSVAGDGARDYIPAHGFLQRPSAAWPPPNADDMAAIAQVAIKAVVDETLPHKSTQQARREAEDEAIQGFSVTSDPEDADPKLNSDNPAGMNGAGKRPGNTIPGPGHDLSIMIDGKLINIKDQIQMYTTNQLISHPLVSPVLQPSLGGLPPLLIMTGGGEILRDEQIYVAHKAANPAAYPPGEAYLDECPDAREIVSKYRPTDVQLQVWDDLCHVAPTLSFTRPAKFMYRSVAQFGAWVLAKAQQTDIEIQDDDAISVISSGSERSDYEPDKEPRQGKTHESNGIVNGGTATTARVGKAGQPLPLFQKHMIRQRVDRHGDIYPLDSQSNMPALNMPSNEIGVIKPGPVSKWLTAKQTWDRRYASQKRKVQKQRASEMAKGYQGFGNDEVPPPSALAGRRGLKMPKEEKRGRSWGMSLWSLWGSSHDEDTIEREEKADREINTTGTSMPDTEISTTVKSSPSKDDSRPEASRSRSRRRTVSYTGEDIENNDTQDPSLQPPLDHSTNLCIPSSQRPHASGVAFPFKLGTHLSPNGRNASIVTLVSDNGGVTPRGDEVGKEVDAGTAADALHGLGKDESEMSRPKVERFETAHEIL